MHPLAGSSTRTKSIIRDYVSALVVSLLAIGLTHAVAMLHRIPAALGFLSIAFVASTGEVGPTLLAALIGFLGTYAVIATTTTHQFLDSTALIETVPYVCASLMIALLVHRRNRALALLRTSEQHYRSITEAAADVVVTISSNSEILSINPAVQALFGYEPEELIGRQMPVLMPERFRAAHLAGMRRYLASGVRHIPWTGIELTGRHKDGKEIPIEISFGSYLSGDQPCFTGFIRDLSERHAAQTMLIQSEKLATVGRLASSIAHEINNPLEAVTNLLYLARNCEDPAELPAYLDLADAELRRVAVIANRTLQFHRQSTTPYAVNSEDLLEGALALYQGRLATITVTVNKRFRARRPLVCAEGDIRQVLNNLIGNAIDALQPSGGRIELRSREARDSKTSRSGCLLTIADTGTGMSPQTQAKIYEPFFSTKGRGGSGLGLWISRELVEHNQGRLKVRSSQAPSQSGTVFTLFLPHQTVERL